MMKAKEKPHPIGGKSTRPYCEKEETSLCDEVLLNGWTGDKGKCVYAKNTLDHLCPFFIPN